MKRQPVTPENLDAFASPDSLREWAQRIGNGIRPVKAARELFPERPSGYVHATRQLFHYAQNKAVAMECRLPIENAVVKSRRWRWTT